MTRHLLPNIFGQSVQPAADFSMNHIRHSMTSWKGSVIPILKEKSVMANYAMALIRQRSLLL